MKRLSTLDILKEIDKDFYAKRYFKGVFARDNIPFIISYPCSLIINTDPSTRPGEHWLALFFNSKKEAEFFDSFGNTRICTRIWIRKIYSTFRLCSIKKMSLDDP